MHKIQLQNFNWIRFRVQEQNGRRPVTDCTYRKKTHKIRQRRVPVGWDADRTDAFLGLTKGIWKHPFLLGSLDRRFFLISLKSQSLYYLLRVCMIRWIIFVDRTGAYIQSLILSQAHCLAYFNSVFSMYNQLYNEDIN
jgi:hypothetical protein